MFTYLQKCNSIKQHSMLTLECILLNRLIDIKIIPNLKQKQDFSLLECIETIQTLIKQGDTLMLNILTDACDYELILLLNGFTDKGVQNNV